MRITALNRGGLAVFDGLYDAHRDEAVVQARDGETKSVTIDYGSAPSALATWGSGITTTAPAVSGTRATLTLSGLRDNGRLDVTATVNGETRLVRIRARSQNMIDRYTFDGDLIGS